MARGGHKGVCPSTSQFSLGAHTTRKRPRQGKERAAGHSTCWNFFGCMRIEIKAQADAKQLMGLRLQRALGRLLIFPICAAIGTLFTQISTGPRRAAMKVLRVASEKVLTAEYNFFLFHSSYFERRIFHPSRM